MNIAIIILCALVVYCYAGYPLFIYLLAKWKPKPIRKSLMVPSVSVVISVHNEEDVIERKIQNLLDLDYPPHQMDIYIGSDGSTDKTNDIISRFSDSRIHLTVYSKRQGKMAVISQLVRQSKGEIIFFNDARQILDKKALKALVENFADPEVGCVSGELMFHRPDNATAKGINLYWEYEKFIRLHESRVHSMLGATGAIYAIRRHLFVQGPKHMLLDDMFIPFKIIEKGYRAIFVDDALAYDQVASTPREEYRRKTRTLCGNYQIFSCFPGLFSPWRSPIAVQLFSHKLLRVILPFILIAIFLLTWMISSEWVFYKFLVVQAAFYGMAAVGSVISRSTHAIVKVFSKVCYIPYVFCLLNFSALIGFLRFIESKQEVKWEKAREQQQQLI
jgi:biofilm PGA synthesis N-glycosyltransferase PgaC